MKTIGVIGGSTTFVTEEYYKAINHGIRQRLGGHHTAEIIINSMDFAKSAHFVENGLWEEGSEFLHGKALSLQRAGADFIICVSNTWHRCADQFMNGIDIPLLHIVDPTAKAIAEGGYKKVALLGTMVTMSEPFLKERFEQFGLEIVVPTADAQSVINTIIFEELSKGEVREESRAKYLAVVDELYTKGSEAVILGCTEIGLLIRQSDRPNIPMFDTLAIHVQAIVQLALSSHP
jgi:aspartate racemase